jgi:hypothetical protein
MYVYIYIMSIYIYIYIIYIYIIHIQETYRSEHSILHLTKALALSLADEELREETADFHTAVPYEINYKTIRQAETPRIPWFMNVYDVYDHFTSFSIIFPIQHGHLRVYGMTLAMTGGPFLKRRAEARTFRLFVKRGSTSGRCWSTFARFTAWAHQKWVKWVK